MSFIETDELSSETPNHSIYVLDLAANYKRIKVVSSARDEYDIEVEHDNELSHSDGFQDLMHQLETQAWT